MKIIAKTEGAPYTEHTYLVQIGASELAKLLGVPYDSNVIPMKGPDGRPYEGQLRELKGEACSKGVTVDVGAMYVQAREIIESWEELKGSVSRLKGCANGFEKICTSGRSEIQA